MKQIETNIDFSGNMPIMLNMRRKVIKAAWKGDSIIKAAMNFDISTLIGMAAGAIIILIMAAVWSLFN